MPRSHSLGSSCGPVRVVKGTNLNRQSTFRLRHPLKVSFLVFVSVVAFALPAATIEKQAKGTEQTPSGTFFTLRMDLLTPADGVDLGPFMKQTYLSLRTKLIQTLPQQVELGERGVVSIRFNVQKDGTIADSYPKLESSSHKKILDEHAMTVVRSSAPFSPLPDSLSPPQLALRATFYYNVLPPPR
jgi:TonB family protein